MAYVNLKRPWFGPNGSRYSPEDNPHEFPDAWADEPEQAEDESDEDFELRKKSQKYAVLPSSAKVVEEGGEVVMTERLTANGTPLLDPQVVDDDVKSVGNTVDDVPEASKEPAGTSEKTADAAKAADKAGASVGAKPSTSGPQSSKK